MPVASGQVPGMRNEAFMNKTPESELSGTWPLATGI